MAFRLPNNVLELSATAGTAAYTFTGVVSGYAAFSTQLGDGDTVPYFARDATNWEVGLGTWTAAGGTLARTLISSSTGGLISWPGTGSREVGCGLPGAWLLEMLDPSATPGFLVRGATLGSWLTRAFLAGSYIDIGNSDGVAGPPTIDDSGIDTAFPRKQLLETANIFAVWTFVSRLIFGGFTDGGGYHELRGQTDELMFRWRRDGANDYDAELRQAASWRRVLTATTADLNDADTLKGFDPTAATNYNFANPGHVVIPVGSLLSSNRLILNFGSNSVGGTATSDVALSRAYGTAHLQAYASLAVSGGNIDSDMEADPLSTTQIRLRNPSAAPQTIRWLSIGH